MPTGYTAPVVDGEVTEFKDFALRCARAFGALISMRDEPLSAPIRDEVDGDEGYYKERLNEDIALLAKLEAMTLEDAAVESEKDYQTIGKWHRESIERLTAENDRLKAMEAKVFAWEPPTRDHQEMKNFMLEQLRISYNDTSFYSKDLVKQTPIEWLHNKITETKKEIKRYTKEAEKEAERIASRNKWIKELKESL